MMVFMGRDGERAWMTLVTKGETTIATQVSLAALPAG